MCDLLVNCFDVIFFLNELKLICLHISIAIVCTLFNGFKHCYITLIILLDINHLFKHSEVVSCIAHTESFICSQ